MQYSSDKAKKSHEKAEAGAAHKKMVMIEKAMHGEKAGTRESKNYRGKNCDCNRKK